jgi:hypothetical protein
MKIEFTYFLVGLVCLAIALITGDRKNQDSLVEMNGKRMYRIYRRKHGRKGRVLVLERRWYRVPPIAENAVDMPLDNKNYRRI